jgi:hypothetical protein
MKIQRRALNGYLLSGFAGGAALGFVAGRYSKEGEPRGAGPALETLRGTARQAPGIHLIGLTTKNFDPFDPYAAEEKLLSRIGFSASQLVQDAEFYEALTLAVRRDYLSGDVVEVEKYLLSETEALFVRYALENQGLVDVAYEAPAPEVVDGHIASDVKFGPGFTVVGRVFNEQPDGHGGIWVQAKNTPAGTVITVNDRPIKTTRKPEALTGAVYGEDLKALIAKPAKHTIALFVPDTGIRQELGEIEIRPRPPAATMENGEPSTVFCEIDEWSVKSDDRGDRIVVKTLCGPRSSAIYLGEVALTTRVRPRTIEAIFDSSTLNSGEQPLRLVDVHSGQAILLGNLPP